MENGKDYHGHKSKKYKKWYINRRYTKPPMGESYQDLLERVLGVMHKIINENCEDVVIATHSAVIMSIRCYITDTPFEEMLKFKTDNTSITEIDSECLMQLQFMLLFIYQIMMAVGDLFIYLFL